MHPKTKIYAGRRFPPPWSIEEQAACFIVRDHNGQQLGYVYFEEKRGRRSAAKLLSKDEAAADCGEYRRVARFIARFRKPRLNCENPRMAANDPDRLISHRHILRPRTNSRSPR
jgi:hypothetical protein